jgi:hypothetical protein
MPKVYDDADRQYFAGFIDNRAQLRPIECCGGLDCWVEFGPPAIVRQKIVDGRRKSGGVYCLGCGGTPEISYAQANRGGRYGR